MNPFLALILLLSSVIAVCGAAAGVWLSNVPEISRRIVPLGGAVLLLLSLFWILPELTLTFGWQSGGLLMFAGFAAVWAIDRFVYPVCPACSHTHDHDACSTRLHGFATPLIAAALVHSIFDGWTIAAGSEFGAGSSLIAGVLVHRIPESIAYGVILQAALKSRTQALTWAVIAQMAMFLGTGLAILLLPVLGSQWLGVLLALGGGTFLYLGFHAVHGEWKRRLAEREVRIS